MRPPVTVLNAFRHHRGRHRTAGVRTTASAGAQRLSASPRWSHPASSARRFDESSAQRLSASPKWCTAIADRRWRCRQRVLNAFRHHRSGHGFAGRRVRSAMSECSTPFGITEVVTAAIPRSWTSDVRCSTPFGITEAALRRYDLAAAADCLCSTPFGITEVGTTRSERRPRDLRRVLNAFRHHRSGHTGTTACRSGVGLCAQRLSASQRSAPCARSSDSALERMCSTPFGITEVGITSARVGQ